MKITSKQVPIYLRMEQTNFENSQTHSLLVNYPTSLLHVIETICYTVKINNNLCVERWRSERVSEWARVVENANGVYTQWFSSERIFFCILLFDIHSFFSLCLFTKRKGFAHRYSIHSFRMHSIREIRSGEFWPFHRCYYCCCYCFLFFYSAISLLFFLTFIPCVVYEKKKFTIFISSFFFPLFSKFD